MFLTFRSIIKYLLLKLLCTLARLCEGIHLQPLRLDFFGINSPSHPCSQLPYLNFAASITRGKAHIAHERALLPNRPTPDTSHPQLPPKYPLIRKSPSVRRAIFFGHAPLEELLPCVSRNIFSVHLPCSYFSIAATRPGLCNPSRM